MTVNDTSQPALLPSPPPTQRTVPAPRAGASAAATPLLYVPGATDGTLQWRAETFQMVNWGGFEGRVRFPFHPAATLISGASGTGKSTAQDGYLALMMPSDTPFNGASNDAVAGRARGAEQRNLLSYLRGQTDTTTDDSGRERPKVLRGNGRDTWGAVAMTFVDDHGRRFTALRVYYVPAAAAQTGDIAMRMATYDGHLDLADLAPHVGTQFAPKSLETAFPGLIVHRTYATFADRLYARLGIGANGDGAKALRLLARIQAAHQFRTVDELYKEMVLERPVTYDAADRAIVHFDDLDVAYNAMLIEQQKADLLTPITKTHLDLVTAQNTIEQIDTFGFGATGDSPITLWSLRREFALLTAAMAANRTEFGRATDAHAAAVSAVDALAEQLDGARAAHQAAGGDELDNLARQISQQRRTGDERRARRTALAGRTAHLGVPLDDQATFTELHAAAAAFLAGYRDATNALQARRDELNFRSFPLLERRALLQAEHTSLSGRAGRVPKFLDDLRRQAADASGIAVDDLPFVAELIDVAPEHARWRTAVETVLGASARLMLVPHEQLEGFSAAIDPLRLRGRLTFEAAPQHQSDPADPDPTTVAGKLLFKDSPFAGWVRRHVGDPARNALCVETPQQLDGPGYRVTLAGQTRLGTRGSHGRNDQTNIIGFSNQDTLDDIEDQLEQIEKELQGIDQQRAAIGAEAGELDRRRSAYEAVSAITWEDINVGSVEARIDELETARQAILAADDQLQALQRRIGELDKALEAARQHRYGLKHQLTSLKQAYTSLTERHEATDAELTRLHHDRRITLGDEQAAALDAHFTAAVRLADPDDLDQFQANLGRLHHRLSGTKKQAQAQVQRAEEELERIFAAYQMTFNDPNLGSRASSYPDYAAILATILTTGLHERREAWRQRLMKWSGEDLVPLAGAMQTSIEEIEERLDPINDILRGLPFGANRDRLRIRLRRLAPDAVAQFRRQLRVLSSGATRELPESEMERRFHELQQFMGRIRRRDDPRAVAGLSDRDRLLDVRRHVEITAERCDADGRLLSIHSSLGGKSGGESQELFAFIVGAALRFRLGDELRARPRFAPVFLDEGFVKSDAEFAGRAVQAWKGLGFQLIVGAPLDKVMALEPHMDELLVITKNTTTHYSFVAPVNDRRGDTRTTAAPLPPAGAPGGAGTGGPPTTPPADPGAGRDSQDPRR